MFLANACLNNEITNNQVTLVIDELKCKLQKYQHTYVYFTLVKLMKQTI